MVGIVGNLVVLAERYHADAKHGLAPNGEISLGLQVSDGGLRDDVQALFLHHPQQASSPRSRSTLHMCGKANYSGPNLCPWQSSSMENSQTQKHKKIFLIIFSGSGPKEFSARCSTGARNIQETAQVEIRRNMFLKNPIALFHKMFVLLI